MRSPSSWRSQSEIRFQLAKVWLINSNVVIPNERNLELNEVIRPAMG